MVVETKNKRVIKPRKRRKGKIDNERTVSIIPQHSNEQQEKAKIELLEEYYNYNTWSLIPISKSTLERLRENAIKWAIFDDKALKIKQFLILNGITQSTWDRWRNKHTEIQEAHEIMLMAIGNRREEGLLTRKFDNGSTMFTMPHYDDDWKKLCEWRAKLAQKENAVSGSQIVVIEKAPSSPLVPERKTEGE